MDRKIFFTGIAIFAILFITFTSLFLFVRNGQPKIDDEELPYVSITSPDTNEIAAYTPMSFSASVANVANGYQAFCTWEFYFRSEEGRELYAVLTDTVENKTCEVQSDGFFREGDMNVSLKVEEVNPETGSADTEVYTSKSYTVS